MDGSPRFNTNLAAATPAPLPVTIAPGDGIGPEIMPATLAVLEAAGARLAPETVTIGEACYKAGHTSGLAAEAWESLARTRLMLKGPITTPQGGGYKSVNVTLRKSLGLFANIRPCRALHPVIPTKHPDLDLLIVRENEEDLYAGIEHRQTDEVVQCLKLISRPGTERLVRYGFALAAAGGVKRVSCFTKDNIMKMTDGLFHRVFDEVAAEHPGIAAEHMIVDIGAAGGDAGAVRVDHSAQPLRRYSVRCGGGNRRVGRAGRIGEYRHGRRDVRGYSRLGPGYRREGLRQPLRSAVSRDHDARAKRPSRYRRAH